MNSQNGTGQEDGLEAWSQRVTDDRLLNWAAGLGVDLTVRTQLLQSLSVGLTTTLWRNTVLEHVHSGGVEIWLSSMGESVEDDDEFDQEVVDAFLSEREEARRGVDVRHWNWEADCVQEIGLTADEERLHLVNAGARRGFGIPDDVMLRANASTAESLYHALDRLLPEEITTATSAGAMGRTTAETLPEFMFDIFGAFADLERDVEVGNAACEAWEILGSWGCNRYTEEINKKFGGLALGLATRLGTRKALWYLAISGASYSSDWWPCPQWERAVDRAHAGSKSGEGEESWFRRPADLTLPSEERMWQASRTPHRLNGQQACWILSSNIGAFVEEARRRDALALGRQPGAPGFVPWF